MADEMTEKQRAFADALLAMGAVQFGTFRLKLHERQPDASLSPIYVNLRVLRSYPDIPRYDVLERSAREPAHNEENAAVIRPSSSSTATIVVP